ncbi:Organic hydroperoxide resistance protein [Amycolatopsis camponoti]|uniref:Organic hydroperoxide resistance protein n=1 Tax=Amycolatopsis camponoti TaxID=2606593 RepID=A0A6I8M369_9PSEU|nr:Organic hydroperoxide resistance protein [Amycolatopsis camponoti]
MEGGRLAHGRASGRARSADGTLQLDFRLPAELGGEGGGTTPEQLFAAGYAASFHATLSVLARETGADPAALTVTVTVAVGPDPAGAGSVLRTEIAVAWPGVGDVRRLVERAKTLCPYAKLG